MMERNHQEIPSFENGTSVKAPLFIALLACSHCSHLSVHPHEMVSALKEYNTRRSYETDNLTSFHHPFHHIPF
jgi:hypothetical protein